MSSGVGVDRTRELCSSRARAAADTVERSIPDSAAKDAALKLIDFLKGC